MAGAGDQTLRDEVERLKTALEAAQAESREAREEAERAGQIKSEFLAVMSHELRTPLTAIMGYTDLLDAEVAGPLNDKQRRQLARIDASSKHLLQIIEEILTFQRMEIGRAEVRAEPVELSELVGEAAAVVEPFAEEEELDFSVRTPERPVELETDPGKVRQILVNLLSNAVKFTDEGGVECVAELSDGTVLLHIRDTGIGIPPEDQERIFEAFWQVERATTREAGGTGLGLSVSRELVRLLGGDITLESVPGDGSTFTVELPMRIEQHT